MAIARLMRMVAQAYVMDDARGMCATTEVQGALLIAC
jgi:hypothetical protein